MASKVVLVMLSTGNQGGAVVRALAKANDKALQSLRGIRLHKGTPLDVPALFATAPAPVYGVFSVQKSYDNPRAPRGGVSENEAPEAPGDGVAADDVHGRARRGGPKSAMGRLVKILFLTQLKCTARLQFIACSDIDGVAALVLQNPERYVGQVLDLAGDQLSRKDMEDGWREVFGEGMRPQMLGETALAWAIREGRKELRSMFKFWNKIGFNADISALREQYSELKDWRTFLKTEVAST
ncbi:hypothetical protein DFH09DRAFT_1087073 [Mycena vulgaris]|nr:hypothetical protein DFH09DRAFT_1087073 [Mycena vulgaris]